MIVTKAGSPATDKQIAFLEDRGIDCDEDTMSYEAHAMIDEIVKEEGEEPATNKQVKMLKYLKYDGDAYDLTKQEASEAISELKKEKGH